MHPARVIGWSVAIMLASLATGCAFTTVKVMQVMMGG